MLNNRLIRLSLGREAECAVRRVRFAPKIADGQMQARQDVVYPIEFKLDGS